MGNVHSSKTIRWPDPALRFVFVHKDRVYMRHIIAWINALNVTELFYVTSTGQQDEVYEMLAETPVLLLVLSYNHRRCRLDDVVADSDIWKVNSIESLQ